MELQEKYRLRYKGRKGRKRLQEIETEIQRLLGETGNRYDATEEMQLLESLLPDPEVRLYFTKRYRDLDKLWSGTLTSGFLRLCGKWIRQKQIEEFDREQIDQMMESLLPSWQWEELTQPAKAAEGAAE